MNTMNTATAPAKKRMSTQAIIGSTFGWDVGEVSEYRYKATRTSRAIYSIGDAYFAVGTTPPADDVGEPWVPHSDQFWAQKAGTTLWVSKAITSTRTQNR